jgi:hypothetical protein
VQRGLSRKGTQIGLVWIGDETLTPPPPAEGDLLDAEEKLLKALEVELDLDFERTSMEAPPPPPPNALTRGKSSAMVLPISTEGIPEEREVDRWGGYGGSELLRGDSVMSSMTEKEEEDERERELNDFMFMQAQAEYDFDEDDGWDVNPAPSVGLDENQLAAHAQPLLGQAGREKLAQSAEVSAELEALKAQLEAARQENHKLKVQVGGEASADEEEALMNQFLELLGRVVEMRRSGAFNKELFEAYNGAMVQLSEGHIKEAYQSFMLLYVGEADEKLLARLGVGTLDDVVIGFAEMMTIKLGELIDQPRHVRVQVSSSSVRSYARLLLLLLLLLPVADV